MSTDDQMVDASTFPFELIIESRNGLGGAHIRSCMVLAKNRTMAFKFAIKHAFDISVLKDRSRLERDISEACQFLMFRFGREDQCCIYVNSLWSAEFWFNLKDGLKVEDTRTWLREWAATSLSSATEAVNRMRQELHSDTLTNLPGAKGFMADVERFQLRKAVMGSTPSAKVSPPRLRL